MRIGCFHAEGGDDLRFAIVEELEIFFFEVGDDCAFGIADDDTDEDQVDADFEGCGCVVGGYLAAGRGRNLGLRLSRRGNIGFR